MLQATSKRVRCHLNFYVKFDLITSQSLKDTFLFDAAHLIMDLFILIYY